MSFIAVLLEGRTEKIFFECLLPHIQMQDRLWFSQKIVQLIDDTIHENRMWLIDCMGDGSVVSYIKRNPGVFMRQDFDYLVLIRDYFPANRPPSSLCKKDLSNRILGNIPTEIAHKYENRIFINLSVEEIEAWFFADNGLFEKLTPILTEEYINQNYDRILNMNPEDIRRPSLKLKKIIAENIPNHRYNKKERALRYVIHRIDMNTCLNTIQSDYVQSFFRLVSFLQRILN